MPLQRAAVLLQGAGMPTPLRHLLGSCQVRIQESPLLTTWQGEVLLFTAYYFIGFGLFLKFSSCFWLPHLRAMCAVILVRIRQTHSAAEERGKNIKEKALMTSPKSPIVPNSAQKIKGGGRNLFLFRGC